MDTEDLRDGRWSTELSEDGLCGLHEGDGSDYRYKRQVPVAKKATDRCSGERYSGSMNAVKAKKSPMAQWVEDAMEHASGMSQSDLARALATRLRVGFDRSKVYKILKGERDVSAEEMLAIEEITDFPAPAALRGLQKPAAARDTAKITRVPVLDLVTAGKLKAPTSQVPVEDVPLLAFADLGRGEFFALNVLGDSMDRLSPEGSIIIVNKADRTLINGRCYVFSHRGETTYKMWQGGEPAHLAPYSTNPANKPIFFKNKRDLEVIGRVKRTLLDL